MRKALALIAALAMLVLVQVGSVTAADMHQEAIVSFDLWLVDGAEDGSVAYYEGTFSLSTPDGVVLETGTAEAVVYPMQVIHNSVGEILYTSDTGYALARGQTHLVDITDDGVAVYRHTQTLLATTGGLGGHGIGTLYAYDNGAHVTASLTFNLRPTG